jgi:hypothetical protein
MGAPDVKPNASGNPGHSGNQTKGAPIGKGSAKATVSKGAAIGKGRIVTPSKGGKLRDGATSRIKGNRMKTTKLKKR